MTRTNNPNKVEHLPDGTTVIILERRNGDTFKCFIDTADYPLIANHRWCASARYGGLFYAVTKILGSSRILPMHQMLFGIKDVDHRDRDGLNNRRLNLRPATRQQQAANTRKRINGHTSRFRGVSGHKQTRKFRTTITVNGKQLSLGYFATEELAAQAYNDAANLHFGEFASLNDIAA